MRVMTLNSQQVFVKLQETGYFQKYHNLMSIKCPLIK